MLKRLVWLIPLLLIASQAYVLVSSSTHHRLARAVSARGRHQHQSPRLTASDDAEESTESASLTSCGRQKRDNFSQLRRGLVAGTIVASQALLFAQSSEPALAVNPIFSRLLDRPISLYVVSADKNVTTSPQREPLTEEPYYLSSEICLLKLLPVKDPLFRGLESSIISLSSLETTAVLPDAWAKASDTMQAAVEELDNKRGRLAPVFNPEDSTLLAIGKGERGERLIENLRRTMVRLIGSTRAMNLTQTKKFQKDALLALSEVGELLVAAFPYDVPAEGKFSNLPRLLGRARVTFTFRRRNQILGNVTIVADGFTAPISAGNFVDLCIRNFYTGLPVKFNRKRLGTGSDFEVANLPVLGSFQEGFYDPLTAKPRRIPLEIIRVEKSNGIPNLSYSQGLTEISSDRAVVELTSASRPLLSFNIPGLVAMNHPDQKENGASSEFFALQDNSVFEDKRKLLDGEYAPFGYITDGYELFNVLKAGDIIDQTYVDEWGVLNLVVKKSSFSEVVKQSSEDASAAD